MIHRRIERCHALILTFTRCETAKGDAQQKYGRSVVSRFGEDGVFTGIGKRQIGLVGKAQLINSLHVAIVEHFLVLDSSGNGRRGIGARRILYGDGDLVDGLIVDDVRVVAGHFGDIIYVLVVSGIDFVVAQLDRAEAEMALSVVLDEFDLVAIGVLQDERS